MRTAKFSAPLIQVIGHSSLPEGTKKQTPKMYQMLKDITCSVSWRGRVEQPISKSKQRTAITLLPGVLLLNAVMSDLRPVDCQVLCP